MILIKKKKECIKMTKTTNKKEEVKVVYVNPNDDDNELKELMEEFNIPTFVSLAKVCGCKPQALYSKKNYKTGEYYYGRIKQYLIEQYKFNKNVENVSIKDIVELASEYLRLKEKQRNQKATKSSKEKVQKYLDKILDEYTKAKKDDTTNHQEILKMIEEFSSSLMK
jgi:hypothetical protein